MLFENLGTGYSKLKCSIDELNDTIVNEESMKVEMGRFNDCVKEWETDVMELLTSFDIGSSVKPLIETLGK